MTKWDKKEQIWQFRLGPGSDILRAVNKVGTVCNRSREDVMRYGYFDNARREYVIERVDLPTSWINYLGVENMAAVVNHTAGGYSFYKSPEYHRISRFRGNSVPMDRPGYYIYIRDNADGEYCTVSWQPVAKPFTEATYRCRHGMSYTVYECRYRGLEASQTMFIPRGGKYAAVGCADQKHGRAGP